MLADVLESKRDQVEHDLEYLEANTEWSVLPIVDRRKRLDGFVEDLIGALRRGWVDDATQPLAQAAPGLDPVLELRERELVRDYVIKEIEHRHLDASPSESAIVADWVGKMDRDRLREENRRLRALLDGVQESAALLAPDGRILYCNRMALGRLRARIGVPLGEIIGRTPAELGVPGELVVGRSMDELLPLARGHESVATTAWGRAYEARFDAVYEPDGAVSAIAVIVRDVHSRKLAETRMDLLTKLAALASDDGVRRGREGTGPGADSRVRRLVRDHEHRKQPHRAHVPGPSRSGGGGAAGRDPARTAWLGSAPAVAGDADPRLSAPDRGERRSPASAGGQRRAIPAAVAARDPFGHGRAAGVARADHRHHDLGLHQRSPAADTAGTIRRSPRSSRCTPPGRSRTRG